MAQAINRTRHGDLVDETLAAAVSEGDVEQLQDGRVGIAQADYAANAEGSYAITGIHEVLKNTSTAFDKGEDVYWDVSANEATDQAGATEAGVDFFLGFAEKAQLAADTTVRVVLRGGIAGDFVVDGSDAGTTQTLANALKAILIENGLMDPV